MAKSDKSDKRESDKAPAPPAVDPSYPDGPPIADLQRQHSAEHYEGKSAADIAKALDQRDSSGQAQVPGVSPTAAVEGVSKK